ncbi:MAG TPA: immunoglobulin domain-containing protein, partial [Verrucomicrobiae bacterium]|nr:immunoglobulin domain-containing protein [Verrucomicrobiae bacterium]
MKIPTRFPLIQRRWLAWLLAGVLLAFAGPISLCAAISIGPSGAGPLTFTSVPPVGDFATSTNQGDATTFFDNASMDAGVAARSAASINTPLPSSGTVNPSASILGFRYNNTLQAIQSRPTTGTAPNNCAATLLLATFQNDTGGGLPSIVLSYDFNMYDFVSAELPGVNVYYSLTGEAGSWQPIPDLTGKETIGNHVASLNLGSWAAGSPLYVLWADDNANSFTDPSYTIDNLRVQFSVEPPVINTQPVASLTVTQTQTIRLSIAATGPGIQYQWFKNGAELDATANPTARQATLVITNAAVADSGEYTVVVSNPATSIVSSSAQVTVLPDTFAPYMISAAGDPLNLTLFTVEVNEPLCTDANPPPVGCGSNASDAFSWEIRPTDGSDPMEILRIIVTGTRLEFETTFARDPSKTYQIIADSTSFSPITDLFENRLAPGSTIDVLPSVLLRQGFNSYAGTKDLELRGAAADAPQEGAGGVTVDTDDGGGVSHGLLRFDDIFGSNPGQIPFGAQVVSATLTLQHNVANANGNPVNLHRMLV